MQYPWDALDIDAHQAMADKRIAAAKRAAEGAAEDAAPAKQPKA